MSLADKIAEVEKLTLKELLDEAKLDDESRHAVLSFFVRLKENPGELVNAKTSTRARGPATMHRLDAALLLHTPSKRASPK